jgi:hypothetical protein
MTYPLYLCHVSVAFAAMKGLHGLGLPSMAACVGELAVAISVTAWGEPRVRRATAWAVERLGVARGLGRRDALSFA